MALYVPGTEETDPKKQNQSLQLLGGAITTNTTDIATNTSAIATINSTLTTLGTSKITNSLGADVALNNTGTYFPGPTVAQGTTGTWFASGSLVLSSAGADSINIKLWDGTTVIASGRTTLNAAGNSQSISISGVIANPAGNIRIDVNDASTTSGLIRFNNSGNSKDSTLTAFRLA